MKNLRTFIISLPEATDRQELMQSHFAEHGLPFELIEAIDGRGFDVPHHPSHDTLKRRLFFGRDLQGGEVGCLLSHRKIYEKMDKENIPLALVFEDDVKLKEHFVALLEESLKHVECYDILRFINKPKLIKKPHKKLIALDDDHHIIQTQGVPGGAYAYLITLDGARKMLHKMERNYLPVDTLMGHTWLTSMNGRSLLLSPGTADYHRDLGSFIGDERFDKSRFDKSAPDVVGWMRILYPFTRAGYKLYENIIRWVIYLLR